MKNINRRILLFSIIIILLCFVSIVIFTLPAFLPQLNLALSTKSNIGSAIGGITAPLIGIISSILLYMALTKQVESNIDQRLKNESDIIFVLINQLDAEISNFYSKITQSGKEIKKTGVEALNDFTMEFRYHYLLKNFGSTFSGFFEANQLLLIVRSYELIEKRIEIASLSKEFKQLFQKKLDALYDCKLKIPLTNISIAVEEHPNMKDDITNEIQLFLKTKA